MLLKIGETHSYECEVHKYSWKQIYSVNTVNIVLEDY